MAGEPSERPENRARAGNARPGGAAGRSKTDNGARDTASLPEVEVSVSPRSEGDSPANPDDVHGSSATADADMRASLDTLVRLIERVAGAGMRGSVLLLDEDGLTLRHGAAPHLPDAYCRLIDGERIGPVAGSCGTAAWRRERVIVRDIATDPLWASYRRAAEPFGLAACWSTPILDPQGRVLGTFAMYYGEPRAPTASDIALTETATALAADIITGGRATAALRARTDAAERLAAALRASEEELRASQGRLRAALDASSTSTWRWDMHSNAVECDDGLFRLFGVDPATASGSFELFVSRIHPDDQQRVIAAALRCAAEGVDLYEEFRIVHPDGSLRWAVDKGKTVLDDDARPRYLIGACVDVTELRAAEMERDRALAEAKTERERLYEVFMQAPAAIAVFEGPAHRFTVANARYCELVGNRAIVGKPLLEALPEIRDQGFVELLDGVYASGEPYSARERVVQFDRDRDGVAEDFYLDFVYQPLKNADDVTFGILVHAVDVTSQVRARLEIAAARADAERANKAKSEFLAAMSHDLRTPLNAIAGYADLAAEGVYGPVTDKQRDAMARIRRAGKHLLSLINDILSFAKVEAGRVQLRITDVRLSEVLASAGAMIEVQAASKGLSFGSLPGPERVRVRADRERMTQVLTNLLTNAVKFTEVGSVAIGWHADERAVRIDVRDTGRGIPADRLTSIFEPFVQAGHSAEEQQQGIGLGLAISRELARAMGGDLTVESAVARGSTFTLSLPRAADVPGE